MHPPLPTLYSLLPGERRFWTLLDYDRSFLLVAVNVWNTPPDIIRHPAEEGVEYNFMEAVQNIFAKPYIYPSFVQRSSK